MDLSCFPEARHTHKQTHTFEHKQVDQHDNGINSRHALSSGAMVQNAVLAGTKHFIPLASSCASTKWLPQYINRLG